LINFNHLSSSRPWVVSLASSTSLTSNEPIKTNSSRPKNTKNPDELLLLCKSDWRWACERAGFK
jgi:hypothetical protein